MNFIRTQELFYIWNWSSVFVVYFTEDVSLGNELFDAM